MDGAGPLTAPVLAAFREARPEVALAVLRDGSDAQVDACARIVRERIGLIPGARAAAP